MTNKRFLFVLLAFVSLIFILITVSKLVSNKGAGITLSESNQTPKHEMIIGKTKVYVELADTPEKRTLGLSGRSFLKENEGMLFDYKAKNTYPIFWMKGMLIPLDIIWINDEKVVQINANVPIPISGTSDSDIPKYPAKFPVDYTLEVNAGFTQKHGISVGNVVDLPEFN